MEDFEYTPKPEYEGPFIVINEPDEVIITSLIMTSSEDHVISANRCLCCGVSLSMCRRHSRTSSSRTTVICLTGHLSRPGPVTMASPWETRLDSPWTDRESTSVDPVYTWTPFGKFNSIFQRQNKCSVVGTYHYVEEGQNHSSHLPYYVVG